LTQDYGDVVILSGNDLESKVLKLFTNKWTHAALRLDKNWAYGINITNKRYIHLTKIQDCYSEYVILRHKRIDEHTKDLLKDLNRTVSKEYSYNALFKLMIRKIKGKEPDWEYIDGLVCSSRIAKMYSLAGLKINDNINPSQIEPIHFIKSTYFNKISEWKKNK
jgi:hypothetical protein